MGGPATEGVAEVVLGREAQPDRPAHFHHLASLEKGFATIGIGLVGAGEVRNGSSGICEIDLEKHETWTERALPWRDVLGFQRLVESSPVSVIISELLQPEGCAPARERNYHQKFTPEAARCVKPLNFLQTTWPSL